MIVEQILSVLGIGSAGQKNKANSIPVTLASDQDAITANLQSAGAAISTTNPLPVNNAATASVALSAPAAALTASVDTPFTFASQVRHVLIQNNTGTDCNANFDAAASAGTYLVPAGQERALDVPCTALHLYSAAASNVNGSSGSNVVLLGWS